MCIRDSEYIKWEKGILTNNITLFKISKEIERISQELKKYNIFILSNFINGSSIIDRLYNSISFVNSIINNSLG